MKTKNDAPKMLKLAATLLLLSLTVTPTSAQNGPSGPLRLPEEKHLRNIRQLTFGGENAEAYFSIDDSKLIFQYHQGNDSCDQIYTMNANGSNKRLVSTGKGRTTCGYYFPDGKRILFSSTHLADSACPPKPDYSKGYVWQLHPTYEIYTANPDGSNLKPLTTSEGYDAEATISRDGKKIVFTSSRGGDLNIYTMNADGSGLQKLTDEIGYDGGPFFSYDGKKICFRAHHPADSASKADYLALLKDGLIRPRALEIFVMDADGKNKKQVTSNGAANFGPYFFPDGKRVIFSSNMENPKGRNFDLYMVGTDGKGLERVTFNETFDGFPMFTSDGGKLVFASNRNAKVPGETNIFIADWVE
jgi:Tol biopolymer transport system component